MEPLAACTPLVRFTQLRVRCVHGDSRSTELRVLPGVVARQMSPQRAAYRVPCVPSGAVPSVTGQGRDRWRQGWRDGLARKHTVGTSRVDHKLARYTSVCAVRRRAPVFVRESVAWVRSRGRMPGLVDLGPPPARPGPWLTYKV